MNQPTELQLLKERAQLMGISHSPNIGVEALRAKIDAAREGLPDPGEGTPSASTEELAQLTAGVNPPAVVNQPKVITERTAPPLLTDKQLMQAEREKQWAEQLALVRIRITCLNPAKKELQGEVITVANDFVGTVKKFIPFGEATDSGYHIPQILLTELQSRQFNQIKTKKGIGPGQVEIQQRLVKEFAIEILPPLSQEEMQQLANQQAAAAGMAV